VTSPAAPGPSGPSGELLASGARIVALRIAGIGCLIANLAIGLWFASTEAPMAVRVLVMALLAVLIVVGFVLLATASRLRAARTLAERSAQADPGGEPGAS
jgi:FtsH-binding integral membrane protein